jgi:hypothetical protein
MTTKNTQKKVRNPETNKTIKINGPTYIDLEKRGYKMSQLSRVYSPKKNYPIHNDKMLSPTELKKSYEKRQAREKIRKANKKSGSPAKGWASLSPKKGKERREIMKKCGSSCFLSPKDDSFPICPKCLKGRDGKRRCTCKPECRGVMAAKMRAKEWKYEQVVDKALKIEKKLKCSRGSPKLRKENSRSL